MASQAPTNRDGSTTTPSTNPQRKILEDLQFKKQMLLKQGVSQALVPSTTAAQTTGWQSGTDGHLAGSGSSQRATHLAATANSSGYFVSQDSSFGNIILPVLPRLDPLPAAPKAQ